MRFLCCLLHRNHLVNTLFTNARILLRNLEIITLQLSGVIPYFSDNVYPAEKVVDNIAAEQTEAEHIVAEVVPVDQH